jgi:hypothetical protein
MTSWNLQFVAIKSFDIASSSNITPPLKTTYSTGAAATFCIALI